MFLIERPMLMAGSATQSEDVRTCGSALRSANDDALRDAPVWPLAPCVDVP
jgi:hypothetical protein